MSHFELVEHLMDSSREQTLQALERVHPKNVRQAAQIVRKFPFSGIFSKERQHLTLKVLSIRADRLLSIAQGRR